MIAPGTGDALGARLVEQAGFEAVYVSGYAVEGSCGNPDTGVMDGSEMAQRIEQIAAATTLPVIADADTGYGDALAVMRTVRRLERAGIAALQLEDQELPKRCGSMPEKIIVPTAAMVGKIKAAVDTREDPNLQIIARTDVLQSEGLEAALERLSAYREAGADLLMCLGPYDKGVARDICRRTPGPLAYLNAESLTMPMIAPAELREMGVPLVIYPTTLVLAAARAMQQVLAVIRDSGNTEPLMGDRLVPPAAFNDIVGLPAARAAQARYAG
ncbi:isocitrate lyase/PEP mutase family protein [Ramlibacter sp. AW1]|uniref:Isocitrate lyase/PEP mutase family protein n=1 Tax=Ramlibacter aurantiacus TaxID=2801330 RepID=A0A937D604_9BURK|nr:isocitrate lyase/PEP mutase family protein [Ramlibacter aurantiacus]